MPPRSSWKGFLRLSLVSVPVKAFTATASGGDIRLNQLHSECHSPVKYQKVCPLHGELDSASIVSGYQYAKGQYVVIDPSELDSLRKESDKALEIDGFYPLDSVDPVHLNGRNYYLVPDGPVAQKAFVLLRQAMAQKSLCAVGQVVLHGKEQLVLLRPQGRLLVMAMLSYATQVKGVELFEDDVIDAEFSSDELALTEQLIAATTQDEFDISRYENTYTTKLTALIEAKVAGEEIVAAPEAEQPKVVELMDALRASVATRPLRRRRRRPRRPPSERWRRARARNPLPSARRSLDSPAP